MSQVHGYGHGHLHYTGDFLNSTGCPGPCVGITMTGPPHPPENLRPGHLSQGHNTPGHLSIGHLPHVLRGGGGGGGGEVMS